jgi:hypothetical protein
MLYGRHLEPEFLITHYIHVTGASSKEELAAYRCTTDGPSTIEELAKLLKCQPESAAAQVAEVQAWFNSQPWYHGPR